MWGRKKIDIARPGVAAFDRVQGFAITYERQTLPDPGAGVYSYETLGLEPFSPIGAGVAVRSPTRFTQNPLYGVKSVPITGMPTVAGQLIHSPLMPEPDYLA